MKFAVNTRININSLSKDWWTVSRRGIAGQLSLPFYYCLNILTVIIISYTLFWGSCIKMILCCQVFLQWQKQNFIIRVSFNQVIIGQHPPELIFKKNTIKIIYTYGLSVLHICIRNNWYCVQWNLVWMCIRWLNLTDFTVYQKMRGDSYNLFVLLFDLRTNLPCVFWQVITMITLWLWLINYLYNLLVFAIICCRFTHMLLFK